MEILIVEDELVSRKKLELLINGLGHETISAIDGQEGWNLWCANRPRIVITDWIMPKMDGLELCKKIRDSEGSQYTYIIMVSSKHDTSDLIHGIEAGADDFISKPYVREELAVRIQAGKRILDFESRDVAIFAISKLAESRDPITGNHLDRIRYYSKVLAQTYYEMFPDHPDINPLFISNIFFTSPLHDIGKIGIPDHILLKKDEPLTPMEFDVIKTHTFIGYNTLNAARGTESSTRGDYLEMSATIALSHHEKYDGSGYPEGLKATEIPLCARIVALADVYDALVSKRVYKDAYSHEIAKEIILKGNGTHFDPDIIDAFLRSEQRFIEIASKFRDA